MRVSFGWSNGGDRLESFAEKAPQGECSAGKKAGHDRVD
jgi:hypothetical protein